MIPEKINAVVSVMRAAPLQNMYEAEQVSQLIAEVVEELQPQPVEDEEKE